MDQCLHGCFGQDQNSCKELDKQNVVYIHNRILFSFERKEIQTHAMLWMNHEDIMLSDIDQSQKTNVAGFHLYDKTKAVKFILAENKKILARFWGVSV